MKQTLGSSSSPTSPRIYKRKNRRDRLCPYGDGSSYDSPPTRTACSTSSKDSKIDGLAVSHERPDTLAFSFCRRRASASDGLMKQIGRARKVPGGDMLSDSDRQEGRSLEFRRSRMLEDPPSFTDSPNLSISFQRARSVSPSLPMSFRRVDGCSYPGRRPIRLSSECSSDSAIGDESPISSFTDTPDLAKDFLFLAVDSPMEDVQIPDLARHPLSFPSTHPHEFSFPDEHQQIRGPLVPATQQNSTRTSSRSLSKDDRRLSRSPLTSQSSQESNFKDSRCNEPAPRYTRSLSVPNRSSVRIRLFSNERSPPTVQRHATSPSSLSDLGEGTMLGGMCGDSPGPDSFSHFFNGSPVCNSPFLGRVAGSQSPSGECSLSLQEKPSSPLPGLSSLLSGPLLSGQDTGMAFTRRAGVSLTSQTSAPLLAQRGMDDYPPFPSEARRQLSLPSCLEQSPSSSASDSLSSEPDAQLMDIQLANLESTSLPMADVGKADVQRMDTHPVGVQLTPSPSTGKRRHTDTDITPRLNPIRGSSCPGARSVFRGRSLSTNALLSDSHDVDMTMSAPADNCCPSSPDEENELTRAGRFEVPITPAAATSLKRGHSFSSPHTQQTPTALEHKRHCCLKDLHSTLSPLTLKTNNKLLMSTSSPQINAAFGILSPGQKAASLVGDFSRTHSLPVVPSFSDGTNSSVTRISWQTLAATMRGEISLPGKFIIIDCRYPYEFNAGHIEGALNMSTAETIVEQLMGQRAISEVKEYAKRGESIIPIFHCEFSVKRSVALLEHLRRQDREMHRENYPRLFYPEMYLLAGGYKEFYENCKALCNPPHYVTMNDKKFSGELTRFSRSKTYSGLHSDLPRFRHRNSLKF